MIKQLLLFFLLTVVSVSLNAENKTNFISREQWAKQSKKYSYIEKYKTPSTKIKQPNINPFLSIFTSQIVKYTIWGFIIALLLFLIVRLTISIIKNSGEKIEKKNWFAGTPIDNIEEADLETLLNSALNKGLFKEALRFRYLILLRTCHVLKYIIWKKDKTNGNYIREMYGKNGFELFRNLTILFDRVWYGNKVFEENDYNLIDPLFYQLNMLVKDNTSSVSEIITVNMHK